MKERLKAIIKTLQNGDSLMLVSILSSSGSVPRGAGARMLVFEDGHTEGTIGGGAVEHAAGLHAGRLLREKTSGMMRYGLREQELASLGMICGGEVTVCFQRLGGERDGAFFQRLLEVCASHEDAWLVRRLEGDAAVSMSVWDRNGLLFGDGAAAPDMLFQRKAVYLPGEPAWYAEPVSRAGRVYIFGGGHVSRELAPALVRVGFSVTVLEDRPEFADPAFFPGAEEVLLVDFGNLSASITFRKEDYVVIMTRGHQADFEILSQVLKHELSYIGCIGSRSKIAATRRRLEEIGFPRDAYDQVHSPIGLDIKAETPAEIAVSVAAEMILHRAELLPLGN